MQLSLVQYWRVDWICFDVKCFTVNFWWVRQMLNTGDFQKSFEGSNTDTAPILSVNPDFIVDVGISTSGTHEAEFIRNNYFQLSSSQSESSFGKGKSMWIRRRKQGTCCGRLKPIVDIQLMNVSTSSAMVLSGYTCITESLGNQWVWIKRASTELEELDSILDLKITAGRAKLQSDRIWSSPGVGWVRVDGNFSAHGVLDFSKTDYFLWYLPNRTRSPEAVAMSPMRSSVVLSDDVRRERVLNTVRSTIRNFVPIHDIGRLTKSLNPAADAACAPTVSPASPNQPPHVTASAEKFSGGIALYSKFDTSGKSKLTRAKLGAMLDDIGVRLEAADLNWCFYCFNVNLNKYITLEEFADNIRLTDHELDVAVDKMRNKLLAAAGSGGNTRNKLRDNRTLSVVFQSINKSKTGILSLEELLEFCAKIELYLTDEEVHKVLNMMDANGNQRVEESEFIEFMKKSSVMLAKKSIRVHEAASKLKSWLQRGAGVLSGSMTPSKVGDSAFSTSITPAQNQWAEIKRRREKAVRSKFPGFICSEDILLLLVTLGTRLSVVESKELMMFVAPGRNAWQNGRIEQKDLISFASSPCRMYGQLDSLLSKSLLNPVIEAYKELREVVRSTGEFNEDLMGKYEGVLVELVNEIESAEDAPATESNAVTSAIGSPVSGGAGNFSPTSLQQTAIRNIKEIVKPTNMKDIYSLTQLKNGIEKAMAAYFEPGIIIPSLEEWASIACRYGALVVDFNVYGVRIPALFEAVCEHMIGTLEDFHTNEKITLEPFKRDLQAMIHDEAVRIAGNGKKPDYEAVFNFFDADSNSKISSEEFHSTLMRWKILGNMAEGQVNALINQFDKANKGFIDLNDFMRFLDIDKYASDVCDADLDLDDENEVGIGSNTPPCAITRNQDCDYYLWYLWREAVKRNDADPEQVITELEEKCSKSQVLGRPHSIRMVEIWRLLQEIKLRGNITKSLFSKCILYLVDDAHTLEGKQLADDDDLVDYNSLCRYVVRMGRTYNNMITERQQADDKLYKQLLPVLKKELVLMISLPLSLKRDGGNSPTKRHLKQLPDVEKVEVPRFQQLLRRMDQDNDGRVTRAEFKLALKRLGCQNSDNWNNRLCQRFFDDIDSKGMKGFLSIAKLTQFIQNQSSYNISAEYESTVDSIDCSRTSNEINGVDEEDNNIFIRRKVIADQKLFKKVSNSLNDIVDSVTAGQDMEAAIKTAVRRYFQKSDIRGTGLVKEEKFLTFIRQSGLQDDLSASEANRLVDKLRSPQASASSGVSMIDYEKLCSFITIPKDNIPRSKSDAVLKKLSDAADKSAGVGRSFLSLCSIIDPKNNGIITNEELIVIAKMMDCTISTTELDALLELLPLPPNSRVQGVVDYKKLNSYLQHTASISKNSKSFESICSTTKNTSYNPNHTSYPSNTTPFSPPNTGRELHFGTPAWQSRTTSLTKYENILSSIADKLQTIIREKSNNWGSPFSLRKQFETFDRDQKGSIPAQRFQSVVEDIGVSLSPTDMHALSAVYAPSDNYEYIDYEIFCRDAVDNYGFNGLGNDTGSALGITRSSIGVSNFPNVTKNSSIQLASSIEGLVTQNLRVQNKARDLKHNGIDILISFASFDPRNTGLITIHEFREVVQRLQLLLSEHQIMQAISQFSSISDRSMIAYEDFCESIESQASALWHKSSQLQSPTVIDGNGFNGLKTRDQVFIDTEKRQPEMGASMRKFRPETHSFTPNDNLPRFRESMFGNQSVGINNTLRQRKSQEPEDLESGSDSIHDIVPKLSDSVNFHPFRSGNRSRNERTLSDQRSSISRISLNSDQTPSTSMNSESWNKVKQPFAHTYSPTRPRVSPARVGSLTWGKRTPLALKGRVPSTVKSHNSWCCAVCLYLENPLSSPNCLICDSPNYGVRTEYQLKEQCLNCAFPNGQFATECEMCGRPLSRTGVKKKGQNDRYMERDSVEKWRC